MNNLSTSIFTEPKFYLKPSAWIELIPTAFFIIEKLKPNTFVELGTHYGCSYFSFCQAIEMFNTNTRAFAVDNWLGDAHSGTYSNEVFEYVEQTNCNNFSHFSNLLRMNFDEAAKLFDNNSVDLLHIDGFHTYEQVKHDFETWLPKMSNKGVVLFHDTQVRERNFGVWQLMDELKAKYPYIELEHGYGLGVVCIGIQPDSSFLEFVAESTNDQFVQQVFSTSGKLISEKLKNHQLTNKNFEIFQKLSQTLMQLDAVNEKHFHTEKILNEQLNNNNLLIEKLASKLQQDQALIEQLVNSINTFQDSLSYKIIKVIAQLINKIPGVKQLIARRVIRMNTITVEKSAFFDNNYYLTSNPDVAQCKMNPAKHYLLHGGFEGRNPSPHFNSSYYLQAYPDVRKAGINPLIHYVLHGKNEGRKANPIKVVS